MPRLLWPRHSRASVQGPAETGDRLGKLPLSFRALPRLLWAWQVGLQLHGPPEAGDRFGKLSLLFGRCPGCSGPRQSAASVAGPPVAGGRLVELPLVFQTLPRLLWACVVGLQLQARRQQAIASGTSARRDTLRPDLYESRPDRCQRDRSFEVLRRRSACLPTWSAITPSRWMASAWRGSTWRICR